MHFDLIDLRLYLNILDAGNITAGAARSGVSPTPAGKALAQHARLILLQSERLREDLADYANGVKGQVRLLCNTTALSEYLPERLADFLREHPPVDVDLQELPSLRIVHALGQGVADLGIVSDAVDTQDLQTRPFQDDPLVLVVSAEHPLAAVPQPTFSDALRHELVGGIVPQATLERWPVDPRLVSRPLPEPWARRKLLLCARSFEHLPSYAKALLDALSKPAETARARMDR